MNDSPSVGVSVVSRPVGGVVVIANGAVTPPHDRLVIAAPAPFESEIEAVAAVVPIATVPNDTDVTTVPFVNVTGGVTAPETGMISVNGWLFHVPSMSSVSVYVCTPPGAVNCSSTVPVPVVPRPVGTAGVLRTVNWDWAPRPSENARPVSAEPPTSEASASACWSA